MGGHFGVLVVNEQFEVAIGGAQANPNKSTRRGLVDGVVERVHHDLDDASYFDGTGKRLRAAVNAQLNAGIEGAFLEWVHRLVKQCAGVSRFNALGVIIEGFQVDDQLRLHAPPAPHVTVNALDGGGLFGSQIAKRATLRQMKLQANRCPWGMKRLLRAGQEAATVFRHYARLLFGDHHLRQLSGQAWLHCHLVRCVGDGELSLAVEFKARQAPVPTL
jgi:hypothetical protein